MRRWAWGWLGCAVALSSAWGSDRVVALQGEVDRVSAEARSTLKVGDLLQPGDTLEGREGSRVQVNTISQKVVLVGPSRVKWVGPLTRDRGAPSVIELQEGRIRMRLASLPAPSRTARLVVRTPGVSLGVRGTDFYASYGSLLGESEIICFESAQGVEFASVKPKEGRLFVRSGQWGGHGGRFGQKLAKPMTLPTSVLEHFSQSLPVQD